MSFFHIFAVKSASLCEDSLGDQVQVLSPKWLAEEISQEHYNALCLYEEIDE